MKKLTALTFATLMIVSALVVALSQPVSALSNESSPVKNSTVFQVGNETNGTIIPGSENGLIVAVGGVIAVVLFLMVILLNVMRKRKKNSH